MSKKDNIIKQLDELAKFADTKKDLVINESWKAQLKQVIITHIDENSPFVKTLDEIKFTVNSVGQPSQAFFKQQYDQSKHNAFLLIFNIKTFIENNGLKKQPNFICRLSEGWATTLSVSIIGFAYWFGTWTTNNTIDIEKINLQNKIDSLTSSFASTNTNPSLDTKSSVNKYLKKDTTKLAIIINK